MDPTNVGKEIAIVTLGVLHPDSVELPVTTRGGYANTVTSGGTEALEKGDSVNRTTFGKTTKGTGGVTDSAYGVNKTTATTDYINKNGDLKTSKERSSFPIGKNAADCTTIEWVATDAIDLGPKSAEAVKGPITEDTTNLIEFEP